MSQDIPFIKKPSLFVATPMYGGQCYGTYMRSCLNLQASCIHLEIEIEFRFLYNESLITRGRNLLVHEFLKSNCTHLLFVDADIQFSSLHAWQMLMADCDILCGAYPKKEIDWAKVKESADAQYPLKFWPIYASPLALNIQPPQNLGCVDVDVPVEAINAGAGFMMVKREVLERLSSETEVQRFYVDSFPEFSNINGEWVEEFFYTYIDKKTGAYLSEDYNFCRIARRCGYKIYIAPWVELQHTGTYTFGARYGTSN